MSPVPRPRRSRLVYRVYGFAAIMAIAVMATLMLLPRYVRGARYLEPQAALLQYLVERLSLKDPVEFDAMMGRIEQRVRGEVTLFDTRGTIVRSMSDPPLSAPTREEIARLKTAKWSLEHGRIVVRSDDGLLFAVYAPRRPGFPWGYVLPLSAAILVLVGAASIWFSRRLARPLDQLANAARAFGAGATGARARLGLV